ncbi:MAG: phosphate ABC transporter substrate-binding protein [Candidatus Spyradocola sp.]|jgi:phosphate transport system substrate-binding protein
MKSILIKTFALLTVLAVLLTGCAATPEATEAPASEEPTATDTPDAKATEAPAETGAALSGELMITGSTSAEPLVTVFGDLFMEANPDVSVAVQGNGSSAGITAATNGTAQLGMSSRSLTEEETSADGVVANTICMDGIAVIVNTSNPVTDLTTDQIAAIFKGEITNWSEVGGNDEEILIISREAGSGTRSAFEEICGLLGEDDQGNEVSLVDESKALIADSTNSVSSNVVSHTNAIGYISLGSYDSTQVKAISVGGVECTEENIVNGSYTIARPFVIVEGPATDDLARAFLDYILSDEGQAVVSEQGYIPVK